MVVEIKCLDLYLGMVQSLSSWINPRQWCFRPWWFILYALVLFVDLVLSIDMKLSDVLNHFWFETIISFGSFAHGGTIARWDSLQAYVSITEYDSIALKGTVSEIDSLTTIGTISACDSLSDDGTISFHGSLVALGAIMFYGSLEPLATITGAVHTCSVVLSGGIDSLS